MSTIGIEAELHSSIPQSFRNFLKNMGSGSRAPLTLEPGRSSGCSNVKHKTQSVCSSYEYYWVLWLNWKNKMINTYNYSHHTTDTTRTPVNILHDLACDLAIQAHSGVKQKTQRTRAVSEACTCCLEASLLKPIWALKFQSISISIRQFRERRHLPPITDTRTIWPQNSKSALG